MNMCNKKEKENQILSNKKIFTLIGMMGTGKSKFGRFWHHLAQVGRFTIFNRSWYGRVLVEYVENFISNDLYERSFDEINGFEE